MAQSKKWVDVSVSMESAADAPVAITAITKANPAVVTSAGHGRADGDIVVVAAQGMAQVDNRVVRIANTSADTFELEGIDSTEFDDFSSGTFKHVTLGTSVTTITEISVSGGGFSLEDDTTIHDKQRVQIPGLPDATTYTMTNKWDITDAGLLAMQQASELQQQRAFRFRWPDGATMLFIGYVGTNLAPGGAALSKVTTGGVITVNSQPTYYTS